MGFSCASAQQPSGKNETPQEQFRCEHIGTPDHRLIGVFRPPGPQQRCRVDYTRDGKTRSLWSSGHEYRFCVRKALEIVQLLEGVNFKCGLKSPEPP